MPHDPLASIKIWPTVIVLGEREFTVPGHSAADWLLVLLQQPIRVMDIIPGLMNDDDQLTVLDMLAEEKLDVQELEDVSLEVLTVVSGRDWWWTLRLIAVLADTWTFLFGQMAGHDLEKISLAAFLDRVYYICESHLESDKRKLFDMELEAAPEGVEVELNEDAESKAFMKMMQQAQQL